MNFLTVSRMKNLCYSFRSAGGTYRVVESVVLLLNFLLFLDKYYVLYTTTYNINFHSQIIRQSLMILIYSWTWWFLLCFIFLCFILSPSISSVISLGPYKYETIIHLLLKLFLFNRRTQFFSKWSLFAFPQALKRFGHWTMTARIVSISVDDAVQTKHFLRLIKFLWNIRGHNLQL